MKISRDRVVCIDYTIRLVSGQVVESSVGSEPLTYLHGHKQIVPGVEQAVEGLESGSSLEIVVALRKRHMVRATRRACSWCRAPHFRRARRCRRA